MNLGLGTFTKGIVLFPNADFRLPILSHDVLRGSSGYTLLQSAIGNCQSAMF
jgi:hypothetical protein